MIAPFTLMAQTSSNKARLIADLLRGAWRPSAETAELGSEELSGITPLLLESGAGAVAWQRVRETPLRASAAALQLQQSYRLHSINAALYRNKIKQPSVFFAQIKLSRC